MRDIINAVEQDVRKKCMGESSGHDWWHIDQVRRTALRIAAIEGGDINVIELGALLHDIADWKFYDGNDTMGPRVARSMLNHYDVPSEMIDHICDIVATLSFKGAGVPTPMATLEGKIVQDADRLQALGAIGIARCFAYGGHDGRLIHDPLQPAVMHTSKEAYIKARGSSINHFDEKLLLLKDRMNTETARKLAKPRHKLMKKFLRQFFLEWEQHI